MITFKVSKKDAAIIEVLALRATNKATDYGINYPLEDVTMDLKACHANGCKLDLSKLAAADDLNFAHDVFGIRRFLDRKTGKLKDHFLPRCAK